MSIEINGPHGRAPIELGDNRKPADKTATSPSPTGGTSASGTDKLSLTSTAQQLQTLEDQITALPVVDTQRVQEVQRSLATGSYQIDPAQVADKMLQFESTIGGEA